jgi:hypothetical protein
MCVFGLLLIFVSREVHFSHSYQTIESITRRSSQDSIGSIGESYKAIDSIKSSHQAVVIQNSDWSFLNGFIKQWRGPIDVSLLKDRLLVGLKSDSASDRSLAINIVESLAKTHVRAGSGFWLVILGQLEVSWNIGSLSEQAASVRIFCRLAREKVIPLSDLERFLLFDDSFPMLVRVSAVAASTVFILNDELPPGVLLFYEKQILERDATLFLAVLRSIRRTFAHLRLLAPSAFRGLLVSAFDPLPRYCIEIVALVKLLCLCDHSVQLNFRGLFVKPDPHVIPELVKLVAKRPDLIMHASVDWFQDWALLPVFGDVPARLIAELLDLGVIPLHAFPTVGQALLGGDIACIAAPLADLVFPLLLASLAALGLEPSDRMRQLASAQWQPRVDELRVFAATVSGPITQSAFGQIVDTALRLAAQLLADNLTPDQLRAIIDIAVVFAPAFTAAAAAIVLAAFRKGASATDCLVFFRQHLNFDDAPAVVRTAAAVCNADCSLVRDHLAVAAHLDRSALLALASLGDVDDLYPTFLALCNRSPEYVDRAQLAIPFKEWVLEEADNRFFANVTKKIIVANRDELDAEHRRVVEQFPDAFELLTTVFGNWKYSLTTAQFHFTSAPVVETEQPMETVVRMPFSPYATETPSPAELSAFLWFSTRSCGVWEDVERFVLSRASEPALVAAFFAYAHRTGLPISMHEWVSPLSRFSADFHGLFALSVYFTRLRPPEIHSAQRGLVLRTLRKLGLKHFDAIEAVEAFALESGMRKVLLASVMPIYHHELPCWFANAELFIKHAQEALSHDDPFVVLCALSNTLLRSPVLDLLHSNPIELSPARLDGLELHHDVVDALAKAIPRHSSLFFLNKAILSPKDRAKFAAQIPRGHALYVYSQKLKNSSDIAGYLRDKPPSYVRQFTIFSQTIKQSRASLPEGVLPGLPALFPDDVAFGEFTGVSSPDAFDFWTPRKAFDSTLFNLHSSVERIMALSDQNICSLFHSMSLDAGLIEFVGDFLRSLDGSQRLIGDVLLVAKAVMERVMADMLMPVILSDDFLNSGNFRHVFIRTRIESDGFIGEID